MENNIEVYNLLLEYASHGTLADLIKKYQGNMPESLVACYSYMLLKGLYHVHYKGFVHCDMKPENILVFPTRNGSNIHNLKIADFGLAKKSAEKEILIPGPSNFNRGTLLYASPESVSWGIHKPATDIWSLGCIIVEMITGKPLWNSRTSTQNLIHQIVFGSSTYTRKYFGFSKRFLEIVLQKE
ncbi:mitogen-activated protein kinase kinase kinase 21 [Forsythia ovata]|uniref:Mitogen-activated protein kinase kinase kinase 21 n=1 Tax=Forsythia ovata TaxID=205694 RepID=A0ABD1QN72_9LAMI